MGKVGIASERIFEFKGIFNVQQTFDDLMNFIKNTLIYEVTIKERDENTKKGSKEIKLTFQLNKLFNEHSEINMKCILEFKGKEIGDNGVMKSSALLEINADGVNDKAGSERFNKKNNFNKFLSGVYHNYINPDTDVEIIIQGLNDIEAIINRFRQNTNSLLK